MAPERRAVVLLIVVALAGQLTRTWLATSDRPPGDVRLLLGDDSTNALARHRARAEAMARPLAPGERIDLDRATPEQVARLPYVGMALAQRIVADRGARGPFGSLQGLDRVPGIGAGLLGRIAGNVTFSGTPSGADLGASQPAPGPTTVARTPEVHSSGDTRLDLNAADSAQLVRLPGIGPFMARRIVAYRNQHGQFRDVEELVKVSGIGPATLARIQALVVVR